MKISELQRFGAVELLPGALAPDEAVAVAEVEPEAVEFGAAG